MGLLDEILGKLVDVNYSPKGDQNGVLNIKTTHNNYNNTLIFTTPEAARAFGEGLAAGNQAKIAENAEKLLSANSVTLKVLPESRAVEYANATMVASTAGVSGVEGEVKMQTIQITGVETPDTAIIRLSSEQEPKK